MLSELIASLLTPSIIASLLKFAILFVLRMWIASWIRKQWHRIRPYLAPTLYFTMSALTVSNWHTSWDGWQASSSLISWPLKSGPSRLLLRTACNSRDRCQ